MCGIAGLVALRGAAPPGGETLAAMADTLRHRGPDDQAVELQHGVGLTMRRLAIIDLVGGQQPLYNEDRTVRAIFNGEIYNFRELRRELEAGGHRFRSRTDGEVIVHLWEELGPEFAARLDGMFAIALHDLKRRELVLVRDRLGIKPLFYALIGDHLVFGSEVKALLSPGIIPRELDLDALSQFLAWEYVPAPATLLRAVKKLEPATRMVIRLEDGAIDLRSYWSVPEPGASDGERTPADWEDEVDAQIRQSVRRQLVSDVPLGALLSGGIDSSLVVAAMGEARAFSIGFTDPTYDEVAWARRVAEALGVEHHLEVLEPEAAELFDRLMEFNDDPIGDFSIFPTYLVSRLARAQVTVALSGDGGDELFGGYETYVAQQAARLWRWLPSFLRLGVLEPLGRGLRPGAAKKGLRNKLRRFAEGLEHDPALEHSRFRLFAGAALQRALLGEQARAQLEVPIGEHILRLEREAGARAPLERQLYVDLRSYLVDNCLVKVDRMSMACSLEVRVPLLDHALVELAFRIPSRLKVHGGRTKILLKRVAARHVPRPCVYRPKEGFSMPVKDWLRGELRGRMAELLEPRRLAQDGLFRPEVVEQLMTEHLAGRANHSHVLWSLMVVEDWRRRWLRA